MPKPLPLLFSTSSSKGSHLRLNESTLKVLSEAFASSQNGIDVVCLTGKSRVGKSSFANCWLINEMTLENSANHHSDTLRTTDLFEVRDQVDTCSRGIYVYPVPLHIPSHPRSVMLLDCEGLEMEDETKTHLLYLFCLLIASTMTLHSRKTLDNSVLGHLSAACQTIVDLGATEFVRHSRLFYVLRDTEEFRVQGRRVSGEQILDYFEQGKYTKSMCDVIAQVFERESAQFVCKMSSPPKDLNDEEMLCTEKDFLRTEFRDSRMFQSFLNVLREVGKHSHSKQLAATGKDSQQASIHMHISEIIYQMRSIVTLINDNKLHDIPNKLASYMSIRMKKMKKKRLQHFLQAVQNDSTVVMMRDEGALRRYLQSLHQSYLEEFEVRMQSLLNSEQSSTDATKTIRSFNKRMSGLVEKLVQDWRRSKGLEHNDRRNDVPPSPPPLREHSPPDSREATSHSRKRKRQLVVRREDLLSKRGFHFSDHRYHWSDTFHDHQMYVIHLPGSEDVQCDECRKLVDDYEMYSVGARMCAVKKRNGKSNGYVRMELPVDGKDICHIGCYELNNSFSDVLFDENVKRLPGFKQCPKEIQDYYLMCAGKRKKSYSVEVPRFRHQNARDTKRDRRPAENVLDNARGSSSSHQTLPRTKPLTLDVRKRPMLTITQAESTRAMSPVRRTHETQQRKKQRIEEDNPPSDSLPAPTESEQSPKLDTTQELLELSLTKRDSAAATQPKPPVFHDPSFLSTGDSEIVFSPPRGKRADHHRLSIKSPHLSPILKSRTPTLHRNTTREAWTPDFLSPILKQRIFTIRDKESTKENIPNDAQPRVSDASDKSTRLTISPLSAKESDEKVSATPEKLVTKDSDSNDEQTLKPLATRPKQRVFTKTSLPPPSKPIIAHKTSFREPQPKQRKLERFSKLELSASTVDESIWNF